MEYKVRKLPLPDVLKFIVDNRGKTVPTDNNGKRILIATNCIRNDSLFPKYEKVRYLNDETYNNWFRAHPKPGDIIFVNKGTPGRVCLVPDPVDFCIAQDMMAFRVNDDIIYNKYLLAFLRSREIQNQIQVSQVGTTIPHFKKQQLKEILVPILDYKEQKKIGDLYYKISYKIELNNQINDNLFKFAISYINNKVEESEVPINKFAKIQGGYAFKSKDLLDDKTNNRIIKIKNLRSEINADVVNSQYVEDEVANSIDSKFRLNKGDVTIAMTGAELGKTGFIYGFDNYYLNQRVGVIRGKNKERELYLKILFLSNEFQTLLNSKGYGSAQPNISTNDIESILINDMAEENLKDIYERLNPIYYRIISNCEENLNLEQLRDTLLPKLMNGEIDLDKIEI